MLVVSEEQHDNSDLFDGWRNGSLHMFVVCTDGWTPYEKGDARYLNLDFRSSDWKALFLGFLNVKPSWEPYVDGDDVIEHRERNRKKFGESMPDLQMLRRIFQMYEDYRFDMVEVDELRKDCTTLIERDADAAANKALRKLIYGCDEALKARCSLMFVCD